MPTTRLRLRAGERLGLWAIIRTIARCYPRRLLLGFVLMAAQAFFYNAIFFTYALVLTRFYRFRPKKSAFTYSPLRSEISSGRFCSAIFSTASAASA